MKTNASYVLGAYLLQDDGPDKRPVEYTNRPLLTTERNYSTTEREALAVVYAVNKLCLWPEGCKTTAAKWSACQMGRPVYWLHPR